MSAANPFAGFNPRPSPWGYNWTTAEEQPQPQKPQKQAPPSGVAPKRDEESTLSRQQLAHLPAALLGTLKREKKPFTYTPGGVDLSEVLQQRLQKRIQRKQKYCEEHPTKEVKFAPPKQVIVAPTYNTPLDMYSVENALEALEVQAELAAHDKSLRSATLPRNHTFRFEDGEESGAGGVAQSKAFRVLQIITDTEPTHDEPIRSHHRDEMRFRGLRDSASNPSRFFHTLQKITGTESPEEDDDNAQESTPQDSVRPSPAQLQRTSAPQGSGPRPASFPPQSAQHPEATPTTTLLKRPAAFLPIKTSPSMTSGFRPVRPPNGCLPSHQQQRRHVTAGVIDL